LFYGLGTGATCVEAGTSTVRVTWTAVALLTAWTLPARLTLSTAPFLVNCFENGVSRPARS